MINKLKLKPMMHTSHAMPFKGYVKSKRFTYFLFERSAALKPFHFVALLHMFSRHHHS